MKNLLFTAFLLFILQSNISAKNFFGGEEMFLNVTDTIKDINADVIDEVVKSKTVPRQEKVQYFSQVTKYGFKNLFKNYSYNPLMPYSSQVNPYAETFMQDYLQAHGSYLQKMKPMALPYFNFIDNILAQYGLPKELKYLAVIESNLNSNATSWVGARGPWQFMSYTAKEYGLQVNGYVDDRTDYYKSTHAAARYLLSLYKDLKDWLLVIAAYNGGPGKVYNAIRLSGSRNFWALQYYLPAESRNHVKKFIATHYIMEAGDDANLNSVAGLSDYTHNQSALKPVLTSDDEKNTDILNISGKYNSVIVAKYLSLDVNEFNRLNPGFDITLSSGEAYDLRLPSEKMDEFVANKYPILNECVQTLLSDVNTDTKTIYTKNKVSKGKRK